MLAFKTGLILSFSIIIGIGVQNLFVIKQGLKSEYPYASALVCCLCDACLLLLSISGVGHLITEFPTLKQVMLVLAVAFLATYGVLAIRQAFKTERLTQSLSDIKQKNSISIWGIILAGLSFSFLNPQALVDTLVIIGSVANNYQANLRYEFIAGTIAASFIWFFLLVSAAKYFSKHITKKRVWQALEIISGSIMLLIALKLVYAALI